MPLSTVPNITASSSGNGQSNKDSSNGKGFVKFAAANNIIEFDDMLQNVNKSAYVLNRRPSSFSFIRSSFSSRHSTKLAVLCGVTYRKKRNRLKGPLNGVVNMRELLVKVFDFPTECIHVLAEEEQSANFHPTKKNILRELERLMEICQKGDSLVFYFSGHGIQFIDSKEDEIDGLDKGICPVDFLREGAILDNEINSTLVWPLKEGVTLHAIVDACHSGAVLDLSYVYDPEKFCICTWKDNKPPAREPIRKQPSAGWAISTSACEDHQVAAETSVFRGKRMNGVMTYSQKYQTKPDITYGGLMEQMAKEIEEILRNYCRPSFLQFRPKIMQLHGDAK